MRNFKFIPVLILGLFFSGYIKAQPGLGEEAYEIVLPAENGDSLKLSELKGKFVLIDFWASWCGPCRRANKGLAKVYKKYKDNGLEIFGVSLDDEEKNWKKAIIKDKITWLQVIDRGGWDAPVAAQWNIEAIPNNYLIDKEGKVIGINLEAKELDKALQQLLSK